MALAALISACRATDDPAEDAGEGLCATLPLAGGTLLEHQARLAASVGAAPIIILVERLPAALTAAVDRLKRDGVRVEIARGLADAVDRVHPDESLLLFSDGCVADPALVARMAQAEAPAMLTVPDDADHAAYERIDATARWGGLLLIDGGRLRRTAARLGEWDLQSTLLRRAVQESARRIGAFDEGDAPLAMVGRAAALAPIERAMAGAARARARDWPGRFLFPPIVDLAALPLMRRGVEPRWVAAAAVALALLAAPFILFAWRWTALGLLLLSGPAAALAVRLAEVKLAPLRAQWLNRGRAAGAGLALLLLGGDLAASLGWGCWLLAAMPLLAAVAQAREAAILQRLAGAPPPPVWLASLDGLIWAFLPAVIAGSWIGAIALIAIYASASFALVQHRLARTVAASV